MIKECLQFLIEPAKKLKIRPKVSRRRVKRSELLTENQLFIMELARELSWICQWSENVLARIWTGEDVWPPNVCREFIMETASILGMKVKASLTHSDARGMKRDWKDHLLCVLEDEEDDLNHMKRAIMDWTHEQRNKHPYGVTPGVSVLLMLDDLESQWNKGRVSHLQSALELLVWVSRAEHLDQDLLPQLWITQKQQLHNVNAVGYLPPIVWKWICDASVMVTLDSDTSHPALLVSEDRTSVRCIPEPRPVPIHRRRFDGWFCVLGAEGISCGRSYWEVELGERDWRVGVAKESAVLKGYGCLNTRRGFYTLRLERGTELKALTTPATPLSYAVSAPNRLGVYVDYDAGQISFYDVKRRSHVYTYCETLTETLYPVFGTAEILAPLHVRRASVCD